MEESSKILIVDDNPEIREVVNILLSGEGYDINEAADGAQAIEKVHKYNYDLIILDVMMPNLNGYQTCMEIRKTSNAPILFLSAKSQVEDKTLGFSSGGDDYLPKPFSYHELVDRVKALIRRYQIYKGKLEGSRGETKEAETGSRTGADSRRTVREAETNNPAGTGKSAVIEIANLKIYEKEERVFLDEKEINLTDIEFAILLLLGRNRRQIFSAQHLYESIWEEPYYYGASNTVMVHIRNLRGKIEKDPHNPQIIKNIWGKGYRCE